MKKNDRSEKTGKQYRIEPEEAESGYEELEPDGDWEESDFGGEAEDWEEGGLQEEAGDWEEGAQPLKPAVVALLFLGVVILAAIICGVLWHFTHGRGGGDEQSAPSMATEAPVQEQTTEPAASGPGETPETEPAETVIPETTAFPPATEEPVPAETAEPQQTETPAATMAPSPEADTPGENASEQEPVSGNETMAFTAVQETVTPKDVINLRTVPSTLDAENIAAQAENGETLTRTGINQDTGWSRIDYNGETLYAVSRYLTTDLTYTTPVQAADPNRVSTKDGRIILFADCDDTISPKEYVNLRLEPSTSEGNATVHCQLNYGETAHRTGYSADSGWSRVEYDGRVLYVVTSMIYVVTETE